MSATEGKKEKRSGGNTKLNERLNGGTESVDFLHGGRPERLAVAPAKERNMGRISGGGSAPKDKSREIQRLLEKKKT